MNYAVHVVSLSKVLVYLLRMATASGSITCNILRDTFPKPAWNNDPNLVCNNYTEVKKCYLSFDVLSEFRTREAMSSLDERFLASPAGSVYSCANSCAWSRKALDCQVQLFSALKSAGRTSSRADVCRIFAAHSQCLIGKCFGPAMEEEIAMAELAVRVLSSRFCGRCESEKKRIECEEMAADLGKSSSTKSNRTWFCKKYEDSVSCLQQKAKCSVPVARDIMKSLVDDRLSNVRANFACSTSCEKYDLAINCRENALKGLVQHDRNSASRSMICTGIYYKYQNCLKSRNTCTNASAKLELDLFNTYMGDLQMGYTCASAGVPCLSRILYVAVYPVLGLLKLFLETAGDIRWGK